MEPAHGFVRTAAWDLVDRTDDDGVVVLTHRITNDTATSPHWPHPYSLDLVTRLGDSLELTLTTTNTGDAPFDLEEALHTYLVVGDVRQVTLHGLDGRSFFDKVTGTERVQEGPLGFAGETDSVFRTSEPVTLDDPVLGRRLVVSTDGSANLVVWNPWSEKAAGVPDIGASHSLTYRVSLEPR
jgi:D-hexose-6-phosphate mutarotase